MDTLCDASGVPQRVSAVTLTKRQKLHLNAYVTFEAGHQPTKIRIFTYVEQYALL